MSDTLITVVAIFLSVILLVVLPLTVASQRVDNVSKLDVETLTSDFIDQIRTTGKLTQEDYDQFLEKLTATGNTYDINMEFKILDENPGKKTTQTVRDKIGENVYYSVYTSQIKESLENNGIYLLKEGDIVSANVKNTNLTIGQQLKSFAYKVIGNNEYTISASKSGLVVGNGSADTVFSGDDNQNKIKYVLKEENQNGKILTTNSWTNKDIYVEFLSSNNLVSDCKYFWRYKKSTDDYEGYNELSRNSIIIQEKNTIQAFWKSASLEKYSNIENIKINIDREKPVINSVSSNSTKDNKGIVTVNATDTGGSGIYNYYYAWTEENENASPPGENSDGWTGNSSFIADASYNNKKCTVWVKDRAGNISDEGKSTIVRNIIPKVEKVNISGAILKVGEQARIHPTFEGGGDYKSITYDISDSSIVTGKQDGQDFILTGKKNGKTNFKCTITNYDGTQITETALVTVVGIEFAPDGGEFGILKNTTQTVTLESQVQVYGEISKLEYAWGNSVTEKPDNWKTFTNGNTITATTSAIGDYYLWIHTIDKGNNSVYYTSNAYTVKYITLADINPKISFTYSITEWTTKDVTVTASTALEGYTLQTSKDGKTWENKTSQTFSSNGTIYARIWNGTEYGAIAAGSVTNIDKEAPKADTVQIRNLTTKGYDIYVLGANDAGSGINRIQFPTWTTANGQDDIQQNWETNTSASGELQSDGTTWVYHVNITDHNNEQGDYATYVYAWDNLGNNTCIYKGTIKVPNVTALTRENVKIEYSETNWTNKNVTVTATVLENVSGFTLQTSQDGEKWQDTNRQVFEKNGTMYIRFWDGNTAGTPFTAKVDNIDKDAPIFDYAEVKNITETGYDVYIYGVRDSGIGVNRVQFPTWTNHNGQDDIQQNWETSSAATGTKQSDGTTWVYHVNISDHNNEKTSYATHIYLYDNLGNSICAYADNEIRLAGTEEDSIKFEYSTKDWTNQNVTVKASVVMEDITFQTSKDGVNWYDTDTQVFETNGTMYVRLLQEGTEILTETADVDNIDKEIPEGTITANSKATKITVNVDAKDIPANNQYGCSGIKGYYYSIDNGQTYTDITTSNTYTFSGLEEDTRYDIKVKVEDNAGNILELSTTKNTLKVILTLSSTSGTVIDGSTVTATISGQNYGTLSVSSDDVNVATASINGNTLSITGTITSGTKTARITVRGSDGGIATYIVTAHRHTGNSSTGGGCYGQAVYGYGTTYCSGCTTVTNTVYYDHECASKKCTGSFSCVNTQTSSSRHTYTNSSGKKKTCTRTATYRDYRCSTCGAGYVEESVSHSANCGSFEAILIPSKRHNSIGYCAGHKVTSTYCPGHTYSYVSYYSRNCGF